MSNKTYVIRKVAYQYNDNHLYTKQLGAIEIAFTDEDEALLTLWELECTAFREADLGRFERFCGSAGVGAFQSERQAVDRYLRGIFGRTVFTSFSNGNLYAPLGTQLPAEITDEQILHIRDLIGMKFYDLWVFDDEATFYGIWLPRKEMFFSEAMGKYGTSIYFFNTYDAALAAVKVRYSSFIWYGDPLIGSLEELSDQPLLLQSLIEQHDGLIYRRKKRHLYLHWRGVGEAFVALNALLKQPVFEIRPISLDQAKQVPHLPFTMT